MQTHIIVNGVVVNSIIATVAEAQAVYPDAVCISADTGAIGWLWDGESLTPPPPGQLAERQVAAWERIKQERDRRKYLGVKVGAHWYHSDDSSRIQQLSLFVMGAAVPPVQWKTLTVSPPPVFVTMTQAIAAGIFQNTAASDAAVFAASEAHRVAMEASDSPESYDIGSGWPASIEDEL